MLKQDLISRNPFRLLSSKGETMLPSGSFGAVLARAGVGKTAMLVQLALHNLLQGKNILHVSLQDPVGKVTLWYKEVFNHIAGQYGVPEADKLWETLLPHRFIMTFKVEGFSVPKLEERLSDLTAQNIFQPQAILVDGLPMDPSVAQPLKELKKFSKSMGMHAWFTVRTHRHEPPDENGLPVQLKGMAGLFDVIIQLQPSESEIQVRLLKGMSLKLPDSGLILDPMTLLIKNQKA